ncbi:hypothetical protein [Vibrio metschnikovii]|uniref:hypothetical protein n=1 Tax=Vibrio metschnikovii TaxID=28172 RepID=UPI001C30C727|nr:hypothetical protein [Vibrio metschnikovii]EKO3655712.1 hypothetical protein [Vibrio metschnikovii]MDA3140277.1 hypothetical protein [Vibrio metschnikovii]
MDKWSKEVNEALDEALQAISSGDIPKENMYKLASIFYSKRNHMNNDSLFEVMTNEIDERVKSDWLFDTDSKEQYKFHFVSSYLFCYVVAGKIDEFLYDQIMNRINQEMDLFDD